MKESTYRLARRLHIVSTLTLHAKVHDNVAWTVAKDSAELIQLVRVCDNYNTNKCNRPVLQRETTRHTNACRRIAEILAEYGAKPYFQGEPLAPAVRFYWHDELPADCTDIGTHTERMQFVHIH